MLFLMPHCTWRMLTDYPPIWPLLPICPLLPCFRAPNLTPLPCPYLAPLPCPQSAPAPPPHMTPCSPAPVRCLYPQPQIWPTTPSAPNLTPAPPSPDPCPQSGPLSLPQLGCSFFWCWLQLHLTWIQSYLTCSSTCKYNFFHLTWENSQKKSWSNPVSIKRVPLYKSPMIIIIHNLKTQSLIW